MEVLLEVTVLFALILALSFLIERFLELVKTVFDLLDSRLDWHRFWTGRARTIAKNLEKRLRRYKFLDQKNTASVLKRFREMMLNEQTNYPGRVPVISGDLVRAVYFKVFSKILAIGAGVTFAFWMHLDLLSIWQTAAGSSQWIIKISSEPIRIALSGVMMGLGSSPVHKIIRTIERQREKQKNGGGSYAQS